MNSSPLSTLPKELRLLIYSFTFSHSEPITLAIIPTDGSRKSSPIRLAQPKDLYSPSQTKTQAEDHPLSHPIHPRKLLALTETCHQIREESLPILLEANDWRICNAIPLHTTHPKKISAVVAGIETWLGNVGPSWPLSLRKVEVETSNCWLGPVGFNIKRMVKVLKRAKGVFREGRVLNLEMLVRVSWNIYQPVHGDVGPFLLRFGGKKGLGEMVEELERDAETMENGLRVGGHNATLRRSQVTECKETIQRMLERLDEDPEWDWS